MSTVVPYFSLKRRNMMMLIFWFYCGCCCGSFLLVVASRTIAGESLGMSRSHCQFCQCPLHWWELFPVLSFCWQRGRCRTCHHSLPLSLLVWELTAGWCFWLSPPVNFQSTLWLLFLLGFQLLSIFDSLCWGYPTWLLLPQIGLTFLLSQQSVLAILLESFLYLALLAFNHWHPWIGNGDLDLLWLLLLILPLTTWCSILLTASGLGLIWLIKQHHRSLPFLPFLFLSTLLYLTGLVCFSA
ncbi:prepilin peptidase [Fructilactobacillus hinvesii]|uniref:prepilin peptidase n=1 Tax=Fructilactobacillus hinvesii TaxID=2940300 RepID=UPI003B84AB9E